jgi:hypothetical protein
VAEGIEREAGEWLADPSRWGVPIDEAVTDERLKAAIRRKAMDARRKAGGCPENPKLLECRDCGRYFPFPYVIRIYRELISSGRKTVVDLAHCAVCREQKGMKTFESEVPELGLFFYDPSDAQLALARERELSEARTRELRVAWAAGAVVVRRGVTSLAGVEGAVARSQAGAVRQGTADEVQREAEENVTNPDRPAELPAPVTSSSSRPDAEGDPDEGDDEEERDDGEDEEDDDEDAEDDDDEEDDDDDEEYDEEVLERVVELIREERRRWSEEQAEEVESGDDGEPDNEESSSGWSSKCEDCDGEWLGSGNGICSHCHGNGWEPYSLLPGGISDPCRECGGSRVCQRCGGTGSVD